VRRFRFEYIEYSRASTKKKDEILVEMRAIGLNFADVYRRKGNYHLKGNPRSLLGCAGVVVDSNNTEFTLGSHCIC
jgi:NADPH2:quinone reductase